MEKAGLEAAIKGAQELLADETLGTRYTKESIQIVKDALSHAETVFGTTYDDAEAGQNAVNEATGKPDYCCNPDDGKGSVPCGCTDPIWQKRF